MLYRPATDDDSFSFFGPAAGPKKEKTPPGLSTTLITDQLLITDHFGRRGEQKAAWENPSRFFKRTSLQTVRGARAQRARRLRGHVVQPVSAATGALGFVPNVKGRPEQVAVPAVYRW
jgi:hypothetical protein